MDRLEAQVRFILEIDRLKTVLRRTVITDRSRQENSAEHSWHLATMALLLAEHADEPVDVLRVVKMLLVHDVVEIDAGDAFLYDEAAQREKALREKAAAERLFGMLPEEQGRELRGLWEEFEGRATADARFAAALDRLQPVLLNVASEGHAWRGHGVTADRVLARNQHIEEGSRRLWELARGRILQAVRDGHLAPGPGGT